MLSVNILYGNNIVGFYTTLKIIHIITGSVLFTTIFTMSSYTLYQREIIPQQLIIIRNIAWFISFPILLLQMITGIAIIGVKQYSYHLLWVLGTFSGFIMLMICWLAGTFCLTLAVNQPKPYYRCWQYSMYLSFMILLTMLFFMSNAS